MCLCPRTCDTDEFCMSSYSLFIVAHVEAGATGTSLVHFFVIMSCNSFLKGCKQNAGLSGHQNKRKTGVTR